MRLVQTFIVVAAIVASYFRVESVDLALALATAMVVIVRFATDRAGPRSVVTTASDFAMLTIVGFECLSLQFSQYPANSFSRVHMLVFCVLLSYFIRLAAPSEKHVALVAGLIGIFGMYLSWSGLSQFVSHVQSFRLVGLASIVPLRSRLMAPPAPYVLGEWLTMLLLTLPFATAAAWYVLVSWRPRWATISIAGPLAITAAIGLACSRALFWSTVVFFVAAAGMAALYRLVRLKAALIGLSAALAGIGIVLLTEDALYPGLAHAYVDAQISQTRSTEGRLAIWKRSAGTFRAFPLIGVGAANAPLFLSSSASEDETTGFASSTFSLPVQVLTEKGLIGTLCYAGFLILLAVQFHRSMRAPAVSPSLKVMSICLAAGLIAVLCRELTYSSLFEQTPTALLTFTAVGILSGAGQATGNK